LLLLLGTPKFRDVKNARTLIVVIGLALAACGSGASRPVTGGNAGPAPQLEVPQAAALSATEHDRLLAAAFDDRNRLYASGWVSDGADQMMAVTRFGADGRIDRGFGADGVATVNVAPGGKAAELARSVVVQSGGKVVVAGPVEHDPAAGGDAAKDTDIALVRLDDQGRPDPSFGDRGTVRLDLSTGVASGTSFVGDTAWGLTRLADDRLLVVGGQVARGEGRTDLDFAVVRLTRDGARDASFGDDGVAVVGVGTNPDTPKTAVELPDGKVVVSGYTRNPAGVVSVVLFRLTPAGTLDPAFGSGGITDAALLGNVTEAYAVGVQGSRLVTTGYGKDAAADKVDMVVGGFTASGTPDPTFGANGLLRVDVAGEDDRGRNLAALPDGSLLMVGSGKPTGSNLDGMVVRITPTGSLDTAFAAGGRRLYDLGGPNDSLFGLAVSPDGTRAAAVGYLGQATDGDRKDDGAVVWLRP